ncbi:hypothetical protein AC623_07065 [Bacillus sp. FJAT-27231]|uniref:hypothetical protein n=1 Tax=Bacillus sp. FJAT-27231 TaxID=1679168 RepID=UPI000671372D|nr:hypothetical protein [Bacillus sp. FJAT-27231]KMY53763.1 hypothetical protein AC623_07065 [Bacillus sp. FJAT-27231]
MVKRFSIIAGGVGITPIQVADIAILVPLQLLTISIIGALSGRTATKETAFEYLIAAGIDLGVGYGSRQFFRQIVKIIPVGGLAISGAIASTGTWTIGKSAEAYFFNNEFKSPHLFKKAMFDKE